MYNKITKKEVLALIFKKNPGQCFSVQELAKMAGLGLDETRQAMSLYKNDLGVMLFEDVDNKKKWGYRKTIKEVL